MSSLEKSALGTFGRHLYPFAVALAAFPFVDMAGRLLPLQLDNTQWRFGAFGLILGGTLVMLMLGLAFVGLVAASREHRAVLALVGSASGTVAFLTLVVIAIFGLDAIQMRSVARPELKAAFVRAAVSAAAAGLLCVTGFSAIAWAAFRSRRALRATAAESTTGTPLMTTPRTEIERPGLRRD